MQNNLGSLHQIPLSKYFREEVKQRMGEGPMGSFLVTRGFGGNWGIPQIWQVAISAEMKLLKLSKKTAKMKNSEQENHIIRIIYFFFDKGCVENISKKFYLAPPGGGYWNIWPSSSYYVTFFIRINCGPPWRRKWQPTPVLLPGEFHGQKNLAGYSPRDHEVRHDWATMFSSVDFLRTS